MRRRGYLSEKLEVYAVGGVVVTDWLMVL